MDNSKDLLLIETMVKLAALNKLLVKKGLISDQELIEEMQVISKDLADQIKSMSPQIFDSSDKN